MNTDSDPKYKKEVETIKDTMQEETQNLSNLSMNELIEKINELAKNTNPYAVAKETEDIKTVFYHKLKAENKQKQENTKDKEPEEEKENKLSPLEVSFKLAFSNYKKNKFEYRKAKEAEELKNLKTKKAIIADIDKLTQEEESIKKTFEQFRILQEQWKNTGHVPQTENNNIWQSYHHHIELFYDYIKINNDLRDLDFKKNLEEKTKICEKAEALIDVKSFNVMHNSLQELHEHWKNIGPVKRELREELWERFQQISKTLNKKRNDYFIKKKEEDQNKLIQKNEICKKINALTTTPPTSHNKWKELTDQCNSLDKEWKDLGKLNKEDNSIAWKNLRAALNSFYSAKNEFFKQKKEDSKKVLALKIDICEQAEKLQENTNWQETGNKLIKLQEAWKVAGFSPKEQSDAIWKRFKAACDTFFNARKKHYKSIDKEKEQNFKAKNEILNKVKELDISTDSKAAIKALKDYSAQWKKIGHVPRNKMKIGDDFFALVNTKFEESGLSKKALEKEKYQNKISSIKGNNKAIASEQQFLRNKIQNLKKEIAQYENNKSFLGTNKSTEPLRKQVDQQIKKANTEIESLKQKLQILNKG